MVNLYTRAEDKLLTSTHVSKSERRNRRREKRQAMMREKYQL